MLGLSSESETSVPQTGVQPVKAGPTPALLRPEGRLAAVPSLVLLLSLAFWRGAAEPVVKRALTAAKARFMTWPPSSGSGTWPGGRGGLLGSPSRKGSDSDRRGLVEEVPEEREGDINGDIRGDVATFRALLIGPAKWGFLSLLAGAAARAAEGDADEEDEVVQSLVEAPDTVAADAFSFVAGLLAGVHPLMSPRHSHWASVKSSFLSTQGPQNGPC